MAAAVSRALSGALILALLAAACGQRAALPSEALAEYPWLYVRGEEGALLTSHPSAGLADKDGREKAGVVEILAVGDILLGRDVRSPELAFAASAAWLSAADLTLGNLECVLTEPVTPTATLEHSVPQPVLLFAPPQAAAWLAEAGFDLLGLANNHALDGGPDGLRLSAAALQAAGLETAGAGATQEDALRPLLREINGVRVAVLSINAIPVPDNTGLPAGVTAAAGWQVARWQRETALPAVRQARTAADVLLVSIHWGYEYQQRVDPAQAHIAEALLEAGADVVIGHHPHVQQAPELRSAGEGGRVKLVAYSLGNFVFDQAQQGTQEGLALRLLVDRNGLLAVQTLPLRAGSQPALRPAPESATPEVRLGAGAATMAVFACGSTCTQQPAADTGGLPLSGLFNAGEADLDGDGQLEDVLLEGGRLTVSDGGQAAWRSPLNWQVVDAALGDPDHDGRSDLLAIFWKPDAAGVLRSHPFLIRYHKGRYEEVWGGSAVSEPILEAEIGDLDGDGLDELVVLEAAPAGQGRSVSVWRWHGWGFSLDWRSQPGEYENLRLMRLIFVEISHLRIASMW